MLSAQVQQQTLIVFALGCRDKLAAVEKRLDSMTAAMRSANPLTPFDFLLPPSADSPCASPSSNFLSGKADAAPFQDGLGAIQAVPVKELAQFRNVEVVVNRGTLGGWVEQASPCCGAAAVAGAWNAVKPPGMLIAKVVAAPTPVCLYAVLVSTSGV